MIHFDVKGTLSTKVLLFALATLIVIPRATRAEFTIVATTSIIADTTSSIAGDDASVSSLMDAGVDPHSYKASPGDLRKLSQASLVLYNGLHLEGKIADALEKLSRRQPVVAVTDTIPRHLLRALSQESATYDPHVWLDVELWTQAAERIRDVLIQYDPQHQEGYRLRFENLRARYSALNAACIQKMGALPDTLRVLVTSHDAFGYFGKRYGLEVMAIQGVSTDSEASLRDIAHIVTEVTARKVPAVFIESSVSPKTIEALVEGSNAKGHPLAIGGELFSDSLGMPGTPGGTYTGMIEHNVDTIIRALSQRR